ncbi:lysine N6-hydroxylase [Onishia taeanensis]|uniref:Lysine N6-hydroxylase n=1 Tax=Onishia taeanensis TaxID=284577 RepID=A0A328XTX9_9GAMM|nr:lysine N(6)-hydroxylase/L-ornithine N(5)-oxygenase family protein [Halomonas taeanensis]RAR63279.1 lysine N6-hydroxylase [Halomonas taeanensis]
MNDDSLNDDSMNDNRQPLHTHNERVHDFIAIGLGPFNLGLACLTEPLDDLDGLFLERRGGFDWHPGMMLEDAHLQTPFLADLVTLADPTSRFSVLNYLKQTGRLYPFYIRENFFLLRREYNQYCQWAAAQLDSIRFHCEVERAEYDAAAGHYRLDCRDTRSGQAITHRARRLVLGTGPVPHVPSCCEALSPAAVHSGDYLSRKAELQAGDSITVVGSGQSAAEIYHDLLKEIDAHGYRLDWLTRSPRFFPLEYGKLTLEMTSPEYIDYFHALPETTRDALMQEQKGLYKGINLELINAIHETLYTKSLAGPPATGLLTNARLDDARHDGERYRLTLTHTEQQRRFSHRTQGLVLATGYRYRLPDFLAPIADRLAFDAKGRFAVSRRYAVDPSGDEVFVQNAELHTHGLASPDLGMACYRNATIIAEMTGREPYPIEERIAFQRFGVPLESLEPAELKHPDPTTQQAPA